MKLQFKKLDHRAATPRYGSEQAAGADLYAVLDEPIVIHPGEAAPVRTGISTAIPDGFVGLLFARSGIACKRGLAPANKVGVIDADFRGEIMVVLHNHGNAEQVVEPGERIAQLVVMPFIHCVFEEVDNLDATVRGEGGFGSTGK